MKKILVVGAGGQGGPCASILARDKDVTEIVLGDIDIELANRVKKKIKSDKITAVKLDAGKVEDIKSAARGADVIINLTLVQFNDNIRQAAVESGAHYVDSAIDYPLFTKLTEKGAPEIDNAFKKAGLTALIGCGGSPGVTNVLARYACDKLDRVDEIRVRLGGKSLEESKEVVSAWNPGWAPEVALTDFAFPPPVFENGKSSVYPIFSGCEEYIFPDPVGPVMVTYHAHEEAVMLPRFIGKGIKYCDFKYPIDHIAGALVKMGFAERKAIDVKGVKVAPIDVLMKLVHHPVDTFLGEDENAAKLPPEMVGFCVVEIKGAKAGENIMYKIFWPYNLFMTVEEKVKMYQKFGTTRIAVALPAIVGAKMCVTGEAERGLIGPECLDPIKFLKIIAGAGAPVQFEEICSKEVSVR
jgi:saccharopine dehydrogenase-like NADP-dependent oxidoreductase